MCRCMWYNMTKYEILQKQKQETSINHPDNEGSMDDRLRSGIENGLVAECSADVCVTQKPFSNETTFRCFLHSRCPVKKRWIYFSLGIL
ncbi:hypothetical protein X777_07453 [Ooceraea biroi]|uniref:Uncharacterized protein n=1 Tax=Ooceraea biroi TaxID=2015173 RepID=A0A026X5E2_OOCBI|nr:hypothetical protein X777_07453 [Ooceraea biroi]